MAEKVLFSVAGGIVNSLAGLLASEIKLLWGAKGELEKLKDTVSTIKAVLLDAEEQESKSHQVSRWLGKLSDVLYEADDLLDAVSTHALRQEIMAPGKRGRKVRIFFSESNQLAFRVKMGRKIKVIRERFDDIAADMKKFQFVERHVETPVRATGRNGTYSFLVEEEVIGRENDKKVVIKSLLETKIEGKVSILPIVGIGGLGKTTLAQLIFNDKEFTQRFDLKMWVCVSDNFDVKILVKKVLESARNSPLQADAELNTLINYLRDEIGGKKYFLVLDDLWNEDNEKWVELKNLIMGAQGSMILVTTRSGKVAKIIHTINPYILRGLEEKASWDLFKKMAFRNGEEPKNSSIEEIGREVVRKCVGVPLAIRAVGRTLSLEDSVAGWLAFKDNELLKISQSGKAGILSTLKLSYDKLPSYLKHCFVYCSLFPKDYEFDKSMLIKLWIAQGFVESQGNRCLEDIGHDYLMELVSRLFFQEVGVDVSHNKAIFKMHDLMHDLAMLMAGSTIITAVGNKKGDDIQKTRHMSVCGDKFPSLNEASRVRTFICFEGMMDFEKIISCLKLLRVLLLRNTNVEGVLSYIGKLKHLRYLDLSNNKNIKKLPYSITKLVNLQTLILFGCERLEELSSDIDKLKHLRYLDLSHNKNIEKFFEFITKLVNLETLILSGCEMSDELLSHIDKLKCLKYLDLSHNHDIQKLSDSLVGLINLETLVLSGCKKLEELPKDFSKLVNLRHLYNDGCKLLCMPCGIGQLTNLQTLARFKVDLCSPCKHIAGCNELSGLSNLRGKLKIYDWSTNIKGDASESMDSKVKSIFNILKLRDDYSAPNLSSSDVRKNGRSGLLSHLSSLTNLVKLEFYFVENCQYLPPLCQLPFLEILDLVHMKNLEYILGDRNELSSSSMPVTCFPSLKTLKISYCYKLKGWLWRDSIVEFDNNCDNSVVEYCLLPMFSCLSQLYISSSPMLISMPIFPHVEGDLGLSGANWKLLQQTFATSPFAPFSKLKSMELSSCHDLETLPMKWLESLTSLKELRIWMCSQFKSLGQGLQFLMSLKRLFLVGCPELELANDKDGLQWQGLKSLLSISFVELPKLVSLPLGLRHVTTLQKLYIKDCPKLLSLSLGLQHATTLQKLYIRDCPKLVSLGLQHVMSLRKLYIKDCESLVAIPECICYKSLEKLEIVSCSSLTSLPKAMGRLTSLKTLFLGSCPELELNNDEDGVQWQGLKSLHSIRFKKLPKLVSLPLGLQHLTTLQELCIYNCKSLAVIPEWICGYKSLEVLEIVWCSNLTSLPKGVGKLTSLKILSIQGCLKLQSCEGERELKLTNDEDGVQQEGLRSLLSICLKELPKLVSLPLWLQHATTLQQVYIEDCESLAAIPEWICCYKLLEVLEIVGCSNLTSLSKGVVRLTSLKSLTIKDCPIIKLQSCEGQTGLKLTNDEDGVQLEGLKSLLSIHFKKLPKLVSLPLWLQHATALQKLYIKDCERLTTIPEWICSYKSLEVLEIVRCSSLTSIPKELGGLTSQKHIRIRECAIKLPIDAKALKSIEVAKNQGTGDNDLKHILGSTN